MFILGNSGLVEVFNFFLIDMKIICKSKEKQTHHFGDAPTVSV